jgi:hypothetical protein
MTPKEQYAELLALTQRYIQQEYPRDSWVGSDIETFSTFKQHALNQKRAQQPKIPEKPLATLQNSSAQIVKPSNPPSVIAKPAPIIKSLTPVPPKKLPPSIQQTKPAEKKVMTPNVTGYNLELLPTAQNHELSDWKKIIHERFPNLELFDEPPNDELAKRINSAWQQPKTIPSVIILAFQETPKERAFLQNIAAAIQARYAQASVMSVQEIENEFGWDSTLQSKNLHLIIANTHGLNGVPSLMQHYREVQKHAKFYLSKVPLYLLSDISLYLKEPKLKPALWQEITALLHV